MNDKIFKGVLIFCSIVSIMSCTRKLDEFNSAGRLPEIFPDYTQVVIPPNIAPLNFYIKEKADEYHVEIFSLNGKRIRISQKSPSIRIPVKKWRSLLEKNTGNFLNIEIYTRNQKWTKFNAIRDSIVSDKIDPYLVYRLINAAYITWDKMGIYQRNVEDFDQYTIFENTSTDKSCVNCHMFPKNNPDKMQLHFRLQHGGTMIKNGEELKKIDTKTEKLLSAGAYPSWHPNGNIIAYSLNVIRQVFTSDATLTQDVYDKASDIALYDLASNTLIESANLSTPDRENLPTWSPDGKWMYFISAPALLPDMSNKTNIRYSLMRISFDESTNTFGKVDTVLSSKTTGMSITFPVVSPDGRYILFGMIDHGYFPVYNRASDIYLYEIATGKYRKLECNSSSTDSYHSWSSSGRWFVFSSKRLDDTYSRPFFCYFDANGKEHKPFILPQSDPLFYTSFINNFNRPEMVTGKVQLTANEVRDLVLSDAETVNVKADKSSDNPKQTIQPQEGQDTDLEYTMH
jgi:hypothetical protein